MGNPHLQAPWPLGAFDGLGYVAQSGVQRPSMLWQNDDGAASADHSADTAAGGIAPRNSASHERPREDWIPIAVPPIVSNDTFALA
jgi:hypothetical protein